MASEKRIYNVNILLNWSGNDQLTKFISVPFPCSKIAIKPIIHNSTDTGAAGSTPYLHTKITSDLVTDNSGNGVVGIILPIVYSTGGMPLAGFTYMFDSPKIINGMYVFNSYYITGAARQLAYDSFICMEFYEA